jgi:hypothetical protein
VPVTVAVIVAAVLVFGGRLQRLGDPAVRAGASAA